ncbi:MAG: winged helix-turn-helix domain-containing protein [Actinomycetia bacterium]|nr:winged helix-turn-helix domain-containing protein [Actinomycetes bacterium]
MAGDVRFAFSATDMARTRFAVSPLWEVVASVRTFQTAGPHAVHRRWREQVAPRLAAAGLDGGLLTDLVPPAGYTPDFITPPPVPGGAGLDAELREVAATPVEEIRGELLEYGLRSERIRQLYDDPAAGLARLTAEITAYWDLALAPYWARVQSVLAADVFHQARRLATDGAEAVLGSLHPTVRWSAGTLTVTHKQCAADTRLAGKGMVLVPSVFAWSSVATTVATPGAKQLFYPSRGWGSVWEESRAPVPDAVAAVLGRTRALLLAELTVPASTSELAGRTGLSAGGVNQHLTALRDAGIVSAHRAGRSVLYMRTAVAESLLAAHP